MLYDVKPSSPRGFRSSECDLPEATVDSVWTERSRWQYPPELTC